MVMLLSSSPAPLPGAAPLRHGHVLVPNTAPNTAPDTASGSGFSASRRWLWLGVALLSLWLGGAVWLVAERDQLRRHDSQQLQSLVQTLDGIVSQQLIAIQAALQTVEAEFPRWHARRKQEDGEALLQTLTRAMPGVKVLLVADATGRVQASSVPELLGRDVSNRPYFLQARREPQHGTGALHARCRRALEGRGGGRARPRVLRSGAGHRAALGGHLGGDRT